MAAGGSRKLLIGAAVVAALVVVPFVAWHVPLADLVLGAIKAAQDLGPAGVVLFALMFIAGAPLTLMAEVFMAAAGLLYGPVWGGLLAWGCALTGASVNLVLGRTLLRERLARRWRGQGGPIADLEDRMAERGLMVVMLLRLPPLSPFHIISYVLSLSKVRVQHFLVGTAVGSLPQVLLFAWLGSTLGSVSALEHATDAVSPATWGVIITVTIGATLALTWFARRELNRIREGEAVVR